MQNKQSRYYFLGLAVLFLTLLNSSYAEGLPPLTHGLSPVEKGIKAPELRFKNLDDDVVDLKSLKGKVVVVNFWATWCPPCRREMASLEKLHQVSKNKNVEVLAVDIGEDVETVYSFLGRVDPSPRFKILFDSDAASMEKWSIRGLPTTYIIKPDGTIVYKAVGGREFDHPDILNKVIELRK